MKTLRREWKNCKNDWTARIRWYEDDNGNIRLQTQTEGYEGKKYNQSFTDKESAEDYWDAFQYDNEILIDFVYDPANYEEDA